MVKVTVYIPCHNYGRYLDKAIGSVLGQSMTDWELILINDGSTDNTREVMERYAGDPRIRIFEQENKGLNVTNNIAIRLANGKYIMRLDPDDYLDENILLILANILDTKPAVGLVYPDYYHVDDNGNIIEAVRRKKIGEDVELLDLPAHGACTMIRKECLLEVGGYYEQFSCQDGYDLWLKMIRKYNPYNVNIPLFYYRQHPQSLTRKEMNILETRRKIKSLYVENNCNGKRPRVLGIVPVAHMPIYSQSTPFVELSGKPLIWYTLSELENTSCLDRVILASEDDNVLEYGKSFKGVEPFKRPPEFGKPTSRMENLAQYILESLEADSGYRPDAVCILYITTPLRRARHIAKAIDTMTIFGVDSVVSVREELAHCYKHGRFGLQRISNSAYNVRIERDGIYKENGAIILSTVDVIKSGRLLGDKIGHIVMMPEESIKINSEFEFWMAEKILREWNLRDAPPSGTRLEGETE